jgi:hypothetical protein
MAKRKAGNPDEGISTNTSRQSSRRKTSNEDELPVPKKSSSRTKKDKAPAKAGRSGVTKSEAMKKEEQNPTQVFHFLDGRIHIWALNSTRNFILRCCLPQLVAFAHEVSLSGWYYRGITL